jgi:DNA-binding response OmpR family regulator
MAWTFLIIDSDGAESARTAEQLKRVQPGCDVLTAESGEAALTLLEEQRLVPSLTFLDYTLPDMNGIEFLGALRHTRWLDGAPVAMLTEPVSDRVVVTCYRFGVSAFLTKPVALYDLRATLRDFAHPAKRMTAATVVPGRGSTNPGSRSAA